jgi:class 3 adenylate cyclase
LLLNDVDSEVTQIIETENANGITIQVRNEVQESGPSNLGHWYKTAEVTAVFADMKKSTALNVHSGDKFAARAYTYFIRGMVLIGERFGADYMDIQGDAIFALFSGGADSAYRAAACAITMRTTTENYLAKELAKSDKNVEWKLEAGIGLDRKTVLVRRLGLRGTKENEVWAGKPVSMAAGLSNLAKPNQIVVSDRVWQEFQSGSKLRRRALVWSCGCTGGDGLGEGLDAEEGTTTNLWTAESVSPDASFDFETLYRLESKWCVVHGAEFCQAIVDGKRPD